MIIIFIEDFYSIDQKTIYKNTFIKIYLCLLNFSKKFNN